MPFLMPNWQCKALNEVMTPTRKVTRGSYPFLTHLWISPKSNAEPFFASTISVDFCILLAQLCVCVSRLGSTQAAVVYRV